MDLRIIVDLFNNCKNENGGDNTIVTDENVVFVSLGIIPNLEPDQMKELAKLLQRSGWVMSHVYNRKDRPEIYKQGRMKWIEIHPKFEEIWRN